MSTRDEGAPEDRAQAEERAWREIVEHYGDAPDPTVFTGLTDVPDPTVPSPPVDEPVPDVFSFEPYDEHFTPPPLPPPPVVAPERRAAWVVLVLAPLLLAGLHLADVAVPGILTGLLIVLFIGSFGYLVATMAPRDPDDDGARL